MKPLSKGAAPSSSDERRLKERIKQYINDFTIARERLLLLFPDNELPEELMEDITQIAERLNPEPILSFLEEATQAMDNYHKELEKVDPQLCKFKEYVEKHCLSEKLTIPKTASFMGMSKVSLYRFLKKEGIGFVLYVNKIRIKHAVRMLKTTNESVSSVGYSCGFNNINYFIEVFKSETGITPGEYKIAHSFVD